MASITITASWGRKEKKQWFEKKKHALPLFRRDKSAKLQNSYHRYHLNIAPKNGDQGTISFLPIVVQVESLPVSSLSLILIGK
jgi:hypothetical protein